MGSDVLSKREVSGGNDDVSFKQLKSSEEESIEGQHGRHGPQLYRSQSRDQGSLCRRRGK